MKKFILFLFVTSLSFQVLCQKNVEVKWGPTYKLKSGTRITGIIGEDKDGFYAVRSGKRGKEYWIERYDNKMNLKFSQELKIPKKDKKPLVYRGIYYINNQLILLTSLTNKKQHKSYTFAHLINKKGVISTKFKKLDEIDMKGRKRGSFDYTMSIDSTKLLVYHNEPYEKYNNEKFSYKVFDSKLNLIWEKDIQLPYKDKYFSINDYEVDNIGNVYMRGTSFPDRRKGEKSSNKVQTKKFKIISYHHKTGKISEHEIKLPNKWVTDISYDVSEEQGEIVVSGFYADDRKGKIKGVFYMAMDKETGKVRKTSIKAFGKDFMTEMIGEKKAEKGKGLTNFTFDYFLVKKDGGAYLIAEQFYITTHTYTDANGNTHTRTVYHYNDVIVVNVNKEGVIDWVRKVPKNSSAGSGYYLSYGLNFNPQTNDLNIFFNDNPKNIEGLKKNPNKVRKVGNLKKSVTVLVSINEEGNMKRTPMFSAKELDKIILRPVISMRTTDTDVITFAIKGKSYKFGRFSFK